MNRWQPPERTPTAIALYAAAEDDRRTNPDGYRLGAEAVDVVIDQATSGRGPDELGDPAQWHAGLTVYLASAQEDGALNALGARMAHDTAVGRLRARTKISRYCDAHPTVSARDVAPPIVIIGGWRTGTTFLYRMLAADPRLRAPLPAELVMPWQLADLSDDEHNVRIEASATAHDVLHLLNPTMAAVHDSGAQLPEECVLAMGTHLCNWGFMSTTRLDGYAKWLADQDFFDEYRQHRRVLQMLDNGDGRRWLLKAPAHTAELPHLAATYPGVCVVHLHRDIVETVASGSSLFATYRSTYSDYVDGPDVGRFQTEQTLLWLRRAAEFKALGTRQCTVVDLNYSDLIADPAHVVRRIYQAADIDPPDTAAMVANHHRTQPRHAKGIHRYSPADFGLDANALRDQLLTVVQSGPRDFRGLRPCERQ